VPKHEAAEGESGPPKDKVYTVGKDGTGQITEEGDDLDEVIEAIVTMANRLHASVHEIPDVYAPGTRRIPPERFDAATRLAFVSAGNALDYAYRLVDEIGRTARIRKLRRELSEEMKAAGLVGDPAEPT
jgi:hypothetical protein